MIKRLEKEISISELINDCLDVGRFLSACEQCPNYGKRWSCPPFDFDALSVWNEYERLLLLGEKIKTPVGASQKEYLDNLKKRKTALCEELLSYEKNGDTALLPGSCDICEKCAREENKPCVFPEKCRYSIEALGGDAGHILKKYFDEKIIWGKDGRPPEHSILLGCVLKGKKNG